MAERKKTLVIVESPSKAKTIGKYLGGNYKVLASVGHVRDLPKSKLGIDLENNFEPQYISIRGKGDIIKEIKKEGKKASKVLLATDPDREGEAISWHLAYLLSMEADAKCRVEFNEITKSTVKEAIKHPREINTNLVDAQQARRVLDRIVGYEISPLLWRKIRRGLSAGRVQSAALKIICDREKIIQDFVPQEYWNINALLEKEESGKTGKAKKVTFEAELTGKNGEKISVENEKQASEIKKALDEGSFVAMAISKKQRQKKPAAPYTTSSLQQDGSNKLNFGARKTMQIAQQLYEGIDIKGRGTVGLITYLRTDSVRISQEAKASAKEYIISEIGKEYYSDNYYSNGKKEVQDAHEAIRPSTIELTPDLIRDSLSRDQYRLYSLIWNRFMASQMAPAIYDSMVVDIENGDYNLKARGSKLVFPGHLLLSKGDKNSKEKMLPEIEKGEVLGCREVRVEQNFTQPPARFTEASLVKELEERNIGRPSTYAPIVGTLTERRYVKKEKKSILPTDLGHLVNDLMKEYFKDVVDAGFTAEMEDKLDKIEAEGLSWKRVVSDFYKPFKEELDIADAAIEKIEIKDEPTGENCPLCGKPTFIKHGRFGEFIACSGYPECKFTKPILDVIGVACPRCGKDLVARRSKRGKLFYGCSGYPECDMSFWYKPVNKRCPKCGSLLMEKKGKDYSLTCSNEECDYKE